MFKKFLKTNKTILITLVLFVFILTPFFVHAQIIGISTPGIDNGLFRFTSKALDSVFQWAVDPILATVLTGITTILFWFFGLFLKLSGLLLNYSIQISVLGMSSYIEQIDGIRIAWEVIRDLINIGFIFMIVYIGVSTILRVGGDTKKLLTKLVLAALLVNFSFFFTGVLIDASNIITTSVYTRIGEIDQLVTDEALKKFKEAHPPGTKFDPIEPEAFSDIAEVGISGVFMQHTGIQTIWSAASAGGDLSSGSVFAIAIFGSMMIFILSFSFLTIAMLLLVRFIILILLLITSPISVIGDLFPGLGKYSKQWWEALWGQLLFAPVFMIMTLVTVLIISSEGFDTAFGGGGATAGGVRTAIESGFSAATIGIIVNYLVVVGFIMATIITAKQFASQGGALMSGAVSKAASFAAGSMSFVGRRTIGSVGGVVADSELLQRLQRFDSGRNDTLGRMVTSGVRFGGRVAAGTAEKAQKGSFDIRSTAVGKTLGDSLGAGGATGKGGRKAVLEGYAKNKDEIAKRIGEASDEDLEKDVDYQNKKRDIEGDYTLGKKERNKKLVEAKQEAKTRAQREYAGSFGSSRGDSGAREEYEKEVAKIRSDASLDPAEQRRKEGEAERKYRGGEIKRWRRRVIGGLGTLATAIGPASAPLAVLAEGNLKARKARALIEKRLKGKTPEQKIIEALKDSTPPPAPPATPPPATP